jgi:hypothetical protein
VVNLALRLSMLYFTLEALLNPGDPRFAGKNLGSRNLIILVGFSLLFPALQLIWKKWERYPVWFDNLYLSLFWMDMLGNSLDLFDRYQDFDLWPHFYGPGALAVVLVGAFNMPAMAAWLAVEGLHALLELQEWLGDVILGSHNVRGWWDTAHDLAAGLAGATFYLWVFCRWRSPKKHALERDDAEEGHSSGLRSG